MNDSPATDYGLYLIDSKLQGHGKSLQMFNLPEPLCDWQSLLLNRDGNQMEANPLIRRALAFDSEQALIEFNSIHSQLNQQQKHAFDTIISKIESDPSNSQFFLQGPAGTGKTFVYNTLCNYYKSKNEIVLCVASSGIAALLLPDGQTSHSLFKIPLSVNECSTCNIRKDSNLAEMIRRAKLIIWDEVPMQHKYCFEAVHRTFQDICDDPEELYLFGGKPVVLGGNFAQIPPVVRRGNRADTVSASVRQSFLWSRFQLLSLTQNMRLTNLLNQNDIAFARFIADISYDHTLYDSMTLPSYIYQTKQLNEFISKVYKDDEISNSMTINNGQYFGERAILATRNDTIGRINEIVLNKMPGEKITLLSTDSADINDADGLHTIPAEYLQSLDPSGLPPSQLELKVGAPVMLLRNIDPASGLCNGTRLIVVHIGQYLLRVRLAYKPDAPIETIPRFTLSSQEGDMPSMLTRKQFPVKLCFAMTINKSQGQSLKHVGIDLRRPPFMHGQLYVALSRVTSLSGVSVLLPENTDTTNNVVYPELLLN